LQQPASAIEAYVQRWRLSHIDDDSNDDQRFDRNRLRHSVWPALLAAFPQAETALMAVAHQAHAADQAIQALGAQALQAIRADDGLPVAAWAALGLAARRASLQCWLREQLGQGPSELLLARLLTELPGRRQGRFSVDALRELRLYRGTMQLQWLGAAGPAPPSSAPEPLTEPLPETDWRRVGVHALPDRLGVLTVKVVAQGGIALADLAGAQLRPRRGGEQFQLSPGGVARSLKKQYQALGVPAWARTGPLVWVGELLVFVPGLGLDARCWAAAGVAQVSLHWRAGTRAP
jgi:tRNA(Ile)-lysidine synthase